MPVSVVNLFIDTGYSWLRILCALAVSIVVGWTVGILAARNESAEKILLPVFDVLQGVPILGFLPIILVLFVDLFPGWVGLNLAVIFLIFSGVGWSMAFAVYEGVRAIPAEMLELAAMENMSLWKKVTTLYVPASWSKVAYNTSVFWSAAVFYLVSSEIFTLGSATTAVRPGIGSDLFALIPLSLEGHWTEYLTALAVLITVLALTRFLFLGEFALWSEKFKMVDEPSTSRRDPLYRFYSKLDYELRSRVFQHLRMPSMHLSAGTRRSNQRQYSTSSLKVLGAGIVILLLAYLVWVLASRIQGVSFSVNGQILLSDEWNVLTALAYSFVRIWGVYGLSVIVGLPLGVVVALDSKLYTFLSPVLQVISSIPSPVFLPAAVIILAALPFSGEIAALLVIFLGMIWYIVYNVMEGVRSIPHEIWEVVQLSKMKRTSVWRHILIPAALPSFVTGSITAVGGGWSVLIVAEYFQTSNGTVIIQVSSGIGRLLDYASTQIPPDLTLMALSLISMTVLIVGMNRIVWKRAYRVAIARYAYKR